MARKCAVYLPPDHFVDVAIVGVGFSGSMVAVHLAYTLRDTCQIGLIEQHSGAIHVLSRHDTFPQQHAAADPYVFRLSDPRKISSVRNLLTALRKEVAFAAGIGVGWRLVIDALRPHTQAIWHQLDLIERRRFFRHLRPYWESHRHRAAPQALEAKKAMETTKPETEISPKLRSEILDQAHCRLHHSVGIEFV